MNRLRRQRSRRAEECDGGADMPNWCNTYISVKGKDAKKFDDYVAKVQENASNDSDFGRQWLGELLIDAGVAENRLDPDKHGNCRGTAYRNGGSDDSGYTYDCDSAWSPCVDVFDTVCQLKGFDVDIEYLATEPGCGVFLASSYEFAGGEYVIDGYSDDGALEDILGEGIEVVTKDELEKRLRNYFNDDTSDFQTLLKKADDIDLDSGYLSINEMEIASREDLRCYHKEQEQKKSKGRGVNNPSLK